MSTERTEWLDGDFDSALQMVAERAVVSRQVGGLVKRSFNIGETLKGVWENDHARRGLIGAGVGAGLGGLRSLLSGRSLARNLLMGAGLGGAIGGGGSMLHKHLLKGEAPGKEEKDVKKLLSKQKAINTATKAREELGILGAPRAGVDSLVQRVGKGEISGPDAQKELAEMMPGSSEQFQSIPKAVSTAFGEGRYGQIPAQLDVLGLKNITPGAAHFDTGTAATAVGANVAARNLDRLPQGLRRGRETLLGRLKPGTKLHDWLLKSEGRAMNRALGRSLAGDIGKLDLTADMTNRLKRLQSSGSRFTGAEAAIGAGKGAVTREEMRDFLRQLGRANRDKPSLLRWGGGAKSMSGKMLRGGTGGLVPMLAGLTPLVLREWGNKGYRAGSLPLRELLKAQQELK